MTKVDSHLMSDKLQPCKESGHLASSRGSSRYKPAPANQAPPISCSLAAFSGSAGQQFFPIAIKSLSGSFLCSSSRDHREDHRDKPQRITSAIAVRLAAISIAEESSGSTWTYFDFSQH